MLNFTRGIYLQALCERAHNLFRQTPKHAGGTLLPVVDRELAKVAGNTDGYWGITESDRNYVSRLNDLKVLLGKPETSDFRDLAEKIAADTEKKVKVVFLTQETYTWASFDSLYRTMLNDTRFNPQIVYVPMEHVNLSVIDYLAIYRNEMRLPVLNFDEYALASECPDIAVFMKSYDNIPVQYYIENIAKAVPRSMYIQYGMEVSPQYIDYHFRSMLGALAWRHIAYGNLLKENAAKYGYREGINVCVWGHPRADCYRDLDANKKTIAQEWVNKINGRFCFLWTPHHTFDTICGSFLDYKDTIISYFEKNKDAFLIWRPHPLLLNNLLNSRVVSKNERDELISRFLESDNMILDTTPDYMQSFFASDAIISDASTFIFEYLYTGQPVVYTKKSENAIYNAERFEKGVYIIANANDTAKTLNQIIMSKDPLKDERMKLKKDLLFVPESGTVGEYITDNCYAELLQEISTF